MLIEITVALRWPYCTINILLMKWLDGPTDFARVLSFDVSKAFDSVSHYRTLVPEKIKSLPGINPYVINWVITFFKDCK